MPCRTLCRRRLCGRAKRLAGSAHCSLEWLDIDPRTVASCIRTGRFSRRMREAQEYGLHRGRLGSKTLLGKRNDSLERHVGELQEHTQSDLEELETVVRLLIRIPAHGIIFL